MTLTDENIKKIETLSIALVLHLKEVTILDNAGFSNTPTLFTFELNKNINQVQITYAENVETDGSYNYSIHTDIPV